MRLIILKMQFPDKPIPLFDLHCDTFSELYKQNLNIKSSNLHVSLDKASIFSPYSQIASIWTDNSYTNDEGYDHFLRCVSYVNEQLSSFNVLPRFILGVEDARILNGSLERLYILYNCGVRVLTLCWKGFSCIGGSWDTDIPLTVFGANVVLECARLGITVDLSHASIPVQRTVLDLGQKHGFAPIFSHSNSFTVCNHKRNVCDGIFSQTVEMGGLVGISLCPQHLSNEKNACLSTIIKHIEHFLNLKGENTLCLGCDFDGVDTLPTEIASITDLQKVYSALVRAFGYHTTAKIFYQNAHWDIYL